MNGVPIIIYHEGRQPYLQECINQAKFELQCFKRFFMIYSLMRKGIIQECIHIDSDVLCYYDFSMFKTFVGEYKASLGIPQKQDGYRRSAGAVTSYLIKEGVSYQA